MRADAESAAAEARRQAVRGWPDSIAMGRFRLVLAICLFMVVTVVVDVPAGGGSAMRPSERGASTPPGYVSRPSVIPRVVGLSLSWDVFFRTPQGTLGHILENGKLPAGANVASNPSAITRAYNGMTVFFRTPRGKLGFDQWKAGRGWKYRELSGGADVAGDPTAIVTGSTIDVFFRTPKGHLAEDFWSARLGWSYRWLPGGADVAGDPFPFTVSSESVDVFFRSPTASLREDTWIAGQGWSNNGLPGGGDVTGDPFAIAPSASSIDVFFRSPASTLREDTWIAGQGWSNGGLPGGGDVAGDPSAVAATPSLVHVLFRSPASTLREDYWVAGQGWSNRILPSGRDIAGDPMTVSNGLGGEGDVVVFFPNARVGAGISRLVRTTFEYVVRSYSLQTRCHRIVASH
jgi:hypothetical protein